MSEESTAQPACRRLRGLEMALAAVIIIVSLANFARIDSASHSASDTLINWIPQTSTLLFVGLVLVSVFRRRRIRSRSRAGGSS